MNFDFLSISINRIAVGFSFKHTEFIEWDHHGIGFEQTSKSNNDAFGSDFDIAHIEVVVK
jgi:hypothetical protein